MGLWRASAIAFAVVAGAVVADACAKSEGVDDTPSSGIGGDASLDVNKPDVSSGGSAGASSGGGAGVSSGGSAGAGSGGSAGVSSGGSAGASTGGNGGTTGGSGGTTGGSGGATGGSGGATGGSGGATGGSGGATGGSGGATGGSGGATGGSGGATGGTGGVGGCNVVSYDFTSGPAGWTASGKNSDWQCGTPTSGPNADHTNGTGQVWATNLTGNSAFCEDSTLTSPVMNLSAYSGLALRLRFWHWHDFRSCVATGICGLPCAFDNSTYSGGIVEAFNGSSWVKLTPPGGYGAPIDCYYLGDSGPTCGPSCSLDGQPGFSGASGGWVLIEIDVSSYAIANFQVRFRFASYDNEFLCHPNRPGWYIDDVSVAKLTCP